MRAALRASQASSRPQKEAAVEGRISTTTGNPCEANTYKFNSQTRICNRRKNYEGQRTTKAQRFPLTRWMGGTQ